MSQLPPRRKVPKKKEDASSLIEKIDPVERDKKERKEVKRSIRQYFGLLLIGFLVLLITVGIFIYQILPSTISDPAKVDQLTDEIAEIEIPSELKPIEGMEFGMDKLVKGRIVMYANDDQSIVLFLDDFIQAKQEGKEAMQGQIDFKDQRKNDLFNDLITNSSDLKNITINGESHEFSFLYGKLRSTDKNTFAVYGTISSDTEEIIDSFNVTLFSSDDEFKESKAIKIIESIKLK